MDERAGEWNQAAQWVTDLHRQGVKVHTWLAGEQAGKQNQLA